MWVLKSADGSRSTEYLSPFLSPLRFEPPLQPSLPRPLPPFLTHARTMYPDMSTEYMSCARFSASVEITTRKNCGGSVPSMLVIVWRMAAGQAGRRAGRRGRRRREEGTAQWEWQQEAVRVGATAWLQGVCSALRCQPALRCTAQRACEV